MRLTEQVHNVFHPLPTTAQAPGSLSSHLLRKGGKGGNVDLPPQSTESTQCNNGPDPDYPPLANSEQTLAQPAANNVILDPLSSAWPRLHMLSGLDGDPKTGSWSQGESAAFSTSSLTP